MCVSIKRNNEDTSFGMKTLCHSRSFGFSFNVNKRNIHSLGSIRSLLNRNTYLPLTA